MKYYCLAGFACIVIFLGLASCATNPVSGNPNFVLMSESGEVELGRKSDAEVRKEYGVYTLPGLNEYVNEVGQKLARNSHRSQLQYHFTVLDSPEINAFALPGGYIYITRGIMVYMNSEAELAGVLGHEIGHVTARHSVQQYTAVQSANIGVTVASLYLPELRNQASQTLINLLGNSLLAGYGREHELEADRMGAEYLARTGYNPQAMVQVLAVLKNQELFDAEEAKKEGREPRSYHGVFATHPDSDTRLQQVIAQAKPLLVAPKDDGRARFLGKINGMVFGDSPAQGIVRKGMFYHEDMNFVIKFPDGWPIRNSPKAVLARTLQDDVRLQMQLGPTKGSPSEFINRNVKFDRVNQADASPINGLPAALVTGTSRGKPLAIASIFYQGKNFVFVGSAKSAEAFNHNLPQLLAAMRSFRPMTQAEHGAVKPLTIHTITAKTNTRLASLARQSPIENNPEGYLRLINHYYPNGEPQPGQTIKIVQ
jgi:predicted Zn-dependent protease